ncbi:MAG TPA: tRNA (cytosine(32)/uridine(32)-2'-O)-methyltransferase TrmJ, partial [Gammaproteobacteria bacterium]|nr:tRNA (cytosine(32)/uridine(32)-2'-O)-methyltransferase TrmJ [Gammaproteobacteria bacterium]
MDGYYQHLEQALVEFDFLDRSNPKLLMRRLRRLYNRAKPDQREINILRGILTAAQSHKNNKKN